MFLTLDVNATAPGAMYDAAACDMWQKLTPLAPVLPTGSPSAPPAGSGGASMSNTFVLSILGFVGGIVAMFAISRLWLCLTGTKASIRDHERGEQYTSLEAQSVNSA